MLRARSLLVSLSLLWLGCSSPPPAQCPAAHEHEHEHSAHGHSAHEQPAPSLPGHDSQEPTAASGEPKVVAHAELRTFENSGNSLVGLATRSLGTTEVEVWRSSIAVGSRTPLHTHESEEVFIVLSGSGVLHVGEQTLPFTAPATVIAPAGIPHWVENTGPGPTDQIVVVPVGSTIKGADGRVMDLPWRR